MSSKIYNCKITVCGETGTGKTCLINRILFDSYKDNEESTLGASKNSLDFKLNDDVTIKFVIWDTMGQEKARAVNKLFYADTDIITLVYDITRENSFNEMKNYWIQSVSEYCKKKPSKNSFIIF